MATSEWKHEIKEAQNYICPVCGKKGTDRTLDVHHKIAKAKNGKNTKENCVAWHKIPCHRDYHKKYGLRTSDDYGNPME